MKAKERVFLMFDVWIHKELPDLSQEGYASLYERLIQLVHDARSAAIADCAAIADAWYTRNHCEGPYWPRDMAKAIRALDKEVEDEANS